MLMSHQGSHDNSVSTRRRARHSSRPLVCRSRDAGTSRDLELVSRCTLHTACSDCAWLTPVSLSMVLGTHTRHAKNDHTTPTPTSAPPTPHRLPPPASPPTSLFAEQPTRLHHAHDGGSVAATEAPTSPLHSSHHHLLGRRLHAPRRLRARQASASPAIQCRPCAPRPTPTHRHPTDSQPTSRRRESRRRPSSISW